MSEKNMYNRGGVWWLRATIKGRQYRESLRTRDVKTARRVRDQRIEEISAALFRGETSVSWKEAVVKWSAQIVRQVGAKTAQRYGVSIGQIERFFGSMLVHQIDGKAVMEMIAGRQEDGVENATIRRDINALSSLLTFCEAHQWCDGNATQGKLKFVPERRVPIVLPEAQTIEDIIAEADPRFGDFIRGAWKSGCRQGEILAVPWGAFNRKRRTLQLIGKGGQLRTIDLPDAAFDLISSLDPEERADPEELIFCDENGEAFKDPAGLFCRLRKKVEDRALAAGKSYRRSRFHDLRHDFAVWALRSGLMGLYELQKHLGHGSITVTEKDYLKYLTPEEQERVKRQEEERLRQQARFLNLPEAQKSSHRPGKRRS